jgi:hypothetical protein
MGGAAVWPRARLTVSSPRSCGPGEDAAAGGRHLRRDGVDQVLRPNVQIPDRLPGQLDRLLGVTSSAASVASASAALVARHSIGSAGGRIRPAAWTRL